MADPVKPIKFQWGSGVKGPDSGPELGGIEGALKSFAWSPLSLLGVDAPPNVERWRAENPTGALGTELAGYFVPYAGWSKALNTAKVLQPIARTAKAAETAIGLESAPFRAAAAREMIKFAPFEGLRVAGSAAFGPSIADALDTTHRGTGEVAAQAGIDILGAGLFGGIGGIFEAAGLKSAANSHIRPGVDQGAPLHIQLRQLSESVMKGAIKDPVAAKAELENLRFRVRSQKPLDGRYVGELEGNPNAQALFSIKPKEAARGINRLFKESDGPDLLRTRIRQTINGPFRTQEDIKGLFARAGLGENPEAYIQYPRYLVTKNTDSGRLIKNIVTRNFLPLDSEKGLYYAYDKTAKSWVLAKRLENTKPRMDEILGKTQVKYSKFGNEWLIFKTDLPGHFAPDVAKFARLAEERAGIYGSEYGKLEPIGADVYDAAAKFHGEVPAIDTRGMDTRVGSVARVTKEALKAVGADKIGPQMGNIARGAHQFTKAYFAPGMLQFDHPLAQRAFNLARHVKDAGEAAAERLFLGAKTFAEKPNNLFKEIMKGARPLQQDNIAALIKELYKDPKQVQAVWKKWLNQASIDEAIEKYGLHGPGVEFAKAMEEVDAHVIDALSKTQKATGNAIIDPLAHHMGVSRVWDGDWRVPVYSGNKLVHISSGKTRGIAQQRANAILEEFKDEGLELSVRNPTLTGEMEQDLRMLRGLDKDSAKLFQDVREKIAVKKGTPTRVIEERQGVGGFIGEAKPWKQDELEKLVLKQLRDYQSFQARLSINHVLKDDLMRLQIENPKIHEQLTHRINSMFGQDGKFSQEVNNFTDKVLAPVLGKNSATKVVNAVNKALFSWSFGMVNVGFNLASMLTFVQTAYPMLAFAKSAPSHVMQKYYTYWPVLGEKSVHSLAQLDMFKLTAQSFKNMRAPSETLWKHFQRAAQDGTWRPRFVEEYIGAKAVGMDRMRGALKGEEPLSKFVLDGVNYLPAKSEEFARAQAFSMAHTFFKDILKVEDDEMLYQLSKQFVEKTQYLYGTGDRARIMTGPLGSALGLFKNWAMHQIGWMGVYADEAFLKGNWKPLLWMLGGTTALGGVAAMPFYAVANAASKWMSNKDIMQHTYDNFSGENGSGVADGIYYGLPAFLNFTIQNQVSAPFADPGQDAARLFSLVHLDRAKYLGQSVGQAFDFADATGQSPVRDPRTRDLVMRALAPKMVYRTGQVWQDKTLRSLSSGNPVTTLSPVERVMYAMGLDPITSSKAFSVSNELWNSQNKMKEEVQSRGKAMAYAMQSRDNSMARQILLKAYFDGVDVSSILKSADSNLQKEQQDALNKFKPLDRFKYRSASP